MANNLAVINAAGATTYIAAIGLAGGTLVMQSIPTDASGNVAWGTAGTPNANVMTVQGISTATPIPGNITQVSGSAVALGQVTMASSFPVVFASNQSALTAVVSGTVSVSGLVSTAASFTAVVATTGTPAAVAVKSSTGTLYGVNLYCNNTTYPVFVKIYNVTAAGVSSSVVPSLTIGVPPGAVNNLPISSNGIALGGTGIAFLITKLVAATDTTAVGAYDVVGGLDYI